MWDCPKCGCMNILDLPKCPQCRAPRPTEEMQNAEDVPATSDSKPETDPSADEVDEQGSQAPKGKGSGSNAKD